MPSFPAPISRFFPANSVSFSSASDSNGRTARNSLRPDLASGEPCENYERVSTILVFDHVTGARLFDLEAAQDAKILELLAIAVESGAEGEDGPSIILFFAGGGAIRLEVQRILCHLEDLGESWPTKNRPIHPVEESA